MTLRKGLRCTSTIAGGRGGGDAFVLPFLYQTTTILGQSRPVSSSIDHTARADDRRSARPDLRHRRTGYPGTRSAFIPFENEESQDAKPRAELEGSTITPAERRAFESLLGVKSQRDKRSDMRRPVPARQRQPQRPSFSDAEYERRASKLDNILGAALGEVQDEREAKLPKALHATVGMARDRLRAWSEERDEKQLEDATEINNITVAERTSIRETGDLMRAAQTDVELWRVFQEKVVDVLRRVQREVVPGSGAKKSQTQSERMDSQSTAILDPSDGTTVQQGPNGEEDVTSARGETAAFGNHAASLANVLSVRVTLAQSTLSKSFPSSPFSLAVLPTIRALGSAAATLALNEQHYDRHLRLLWKRYQDLPGILKTLQTMEDEVITFTDQTACVISQALDFASNASQGVYGEVVRIIWAMEARRAEVKSLRSWGRRVDESRKEEGLRKARDAAVEAAGPQLRKTPN